MFLLRLAEGSPPAAGLEERGELCRNRGRDATDQGSRWTKARPSLVSFPASLQPGSPHVGLTPMFLLQCQLLSLGAVASAAYGLLLADLNPESDHVSASSLEGRILFFLEVWYSEGALAGGFSVRMLSAGYPLDPNPSH